MKSSRNELEQRYLLLFKIDAKNLFDRISERRQDYIDAFSLKRNRAVFKDIFENRYQKCSIADLAYCPAEVIEALNQYYTNVDKLFWYLKHTQDMPNTIEDEVNRKVNKLRKDFEMACLYIDATLAGESLPEVDFDAPVLDDDGKPFETLGEAAIFEESQEFLQPEVYPDLFEQDEPEAETETTK